MRRFGLLRPGFDPAGERLLSLVLRLGIRNTDQARVDGDDRT
jgi:hypothetical protein